MANALKCDMCGKLFEERDNEVKIKGFDNAHLVKLSVVDGKTSRDICRGCTCKFAKLIVDTCEQKDLEDYGL